MVGRYGPKASDEHYDSRSHDVHVLMTRRMYWGSVDMNEVVAEVKKLGPHWDKKGGADHIFVVSIG